MKALIYISILFASCTTIKTTPYCGRIDLPINEKFISGTWIGDKVSFCTRKMRDDEFPELPKIYQDGKWITVVEHQIKWIPRSNY